MLDASFDLTAIDDDETVHLPIGFLNVMFEGPGKEARVTVLGGVKAPQTTLMRPPLQGVWRSRFSVPAGSMSFGVVGIGVKWRFTVVEWR